MEQPLKHECGIALVRLLKPLSYFQEKYGSWQWGLNKLYLLMEKQHNRGQEGAGLAIQNMHAPVGQEYLFVEKAEGSGAINEIFRMVHEHYAHAQAQGLDLDDAQNVAEKLPYCGELYMGHLRYSTTGKKGLKYVHPFTRHNNWRSRNLCLCGNFNMTNIGETMAHQIAKGQHPQEVADSLIILENVGHFLDREVQRKFEHYKTQIKPNGKHITSQVVSRMVEDTLDLGDILRGASKYWDGGYAICGLLGHGDSFAMRDPWGIRPAFYYHNDEFAVVASERAVIQTTFDLEAKAVQELLPGQAILIRKNGEVNIQQVRQAQKFSACSFERIYFSRGTDMDIYQERKKLGEMLTPPILEAINYDIEHTVFSYIPNTAESAFFGMSDGMNRYLNHKKRDLILSRKDHLSEDEVQSILSMQVRIEKVAVKDIKLRTFITQDEARNDLVSHVYDITYGSLRPYVDNLVIIDDSIVRGTTLKESIIKILDRLHPKKIVVVSSCPQIRYPDYYGIDMSRLNEFIAFRATIELLKERGLESIIQKSYALALEQEAEYQDYWGQEDVEYCLEANPFSDMQNPIRMLYDPFSPQEISQKIAQMIRAEGVGAEIEVVFQSIEGLHQACPKHAGDWFFTGNYPTPGGKRLANKALIQYVEGNETKVIS